MLFTAGPTIFNELLGAKSDEKKTTIAPTLHGCPRGKSSYSERYYGRFQSFVLIAGIFFLLRVKFSTFYIFSHLAHDVSLEPHRPPFVQPEVLPSPAALRVIHPPPSKPREKQKQKKLEMITKHKQNIIKKVQIWGEKIEQESVQEYCTHRRRQAVDMTLCSRPPPPPRPQHTIRGGL